MKRLTFAILAAAAGLDSATAADAAAPLAVPTAAPAVLPAALLAAVPAAVQRISLKAFAAMISSADEAIRAQRLEVDIADESIRGASSIFEPFAFATLEREGMRVLNSAQDAARRGTLPRDVFFSRESRLKTGVALKSPIGTDLELSYSTSALRDSIQPDKVPMVSPEYKGYLGVKLTQPLWRGAGIDATRAGIAIAETEKGVAHETVRQLTSQRVMDGLQAYIFTQRAEQRVRLRGAALGVAAEIEREVAQQHAEGLRSLAERTEARSSLALRRAQLAQAEQDQEEQQNALQIFVAAHDTPKDSALTGSMLRPGDPLALAPAWPEAAPSADGASLLDAVVKRRPETRVSVIRIEREERKLELARNQTLPDINFTLRMGKEDLSSANRPITDYFNNVVPYNSWQVGITFRIGLWNDDKKGSEYQTAVHRREQAKLSLAAVRQRIANEVQISASLVDKARQQVDRQREIVEAQQSLLKVERELVREGRRSALDVQRKRLELLLAEEALGDAVAQANRAGWVASLVDGSLLARLDLE